ncbi:Cache domain-containing protein [Desulfatibacillum alkenivorans DSM 16219]|jgi:signal transduction histidine kinase|uniref:Cache domain-containing protein n=1 Tax=Desulfatibacillum alkenivorans DSM 16219 TaxID=1121393 RepID=A0A1M6PTS8_9BACT|nr:cache domain-containing protein [Desulfatibacillum alkenivorans]SHK11363.1 Cache domain-containing protein [Desulfatibacillum alkenivorans DSM 16219]
MKKLFGWLPKAAVFAALFSLILPAFAADKATKEECMAKCEAAALSMETKGVAEAFKAINDKEGDFVWKDSYVFCLDLEKQCNAAHPISPALIGRNLMMAKDVNGKMFFAEFISVALNQGDGWVSYMWPKPGDQGPSPKITYVKKVPNQPYAMCAGIYE